MCTVYVLLCFSASCRRSTEQDFDDVHSRLRRGDIIGITGNPGLTSHTVYTALFIYQYIYARHTSSITCSYVACSVAEFCVILLLLKCH